MSIHIIIISCISLINILWSFVFVYSGCCEVLWNKSCSCSRSLKTRIRQPRQRRTTRYAQRGIVEVLCLCSMPFEINYLKNHGSQIFHQLLLDLFSKLLRSLLFSNPWMLTVISMFSSAFLVHGWEWPRDRKGTGLKNLATTMLVMKRIVLMANG